jgi:hypothetical protein
MFDLQKIREKISKKAIYYFESVNIIFEKNRLYFSPLFIIEINRFKEKSQVSKILGIN